MKTIITVAVIITLTIIACGKDKFETKPQLKVKSQSTDIVSLNGNFRVTLEYTDKEGDVDDSLIIVRQRLNRSKPKILPPLPYPIPTFPDINKGEIVVNFRYAQDLTLNLSAIRIPGSNPAQFEIDTMILKFVVRDKGGNKSDTATTDVFVRRQ